MQTKALLTAATREAQAWLEAKYDAGLPPFFSATSRWTFPAPPDLVKAAQEAYADPNAYPIDTRGLAYSYAFIGIKRLGAGQFYLISIRDKDGDAFDGGKTYRLTVPANAPVEQYWSVTAYDRQTHALIKNMSRASRSSQIPEMQKNADGSVDIYFGPAAPAGKETNWVPTDPARKFELMFRALRADQGTVRKELGAFRCRASLVTNDGSAAMKEDNDNCCSVAALLFAKFCANELASTVRRARVHTRTYGSRAFGRCARATRQSGLCRGAGARRLLLGATLRSTCFGRTNMWEMMKDGTGSHVRPRCPVRP